MMMMMIRTCRRSSSRIRGQRHDYRKERTTVSSSSIHDDVWSSYRRRRHIGCNCNQQQYQQHQHQDVSYSLHDTCSEGQSMNGSSHNISCVQRRPSNIQLSSTIHYFRHHDGGPIHRHNYNHQQHYQPSMLSHLLSSSPTTTTTTTKPTMSTIGLTSFFFFRRHFSTSSIPTNNATSSIPSSSTTSIQIKKTKMDSTTGQASTNARIRQSTATTGAASSSSSSTIIISSSLSSIDVQGDGGDDYDHDHDNDVDTIVGMKMATKGSSTTTTTKTKTMKKTKKMMNHHPSSSSSAAAAPSVQYRNNNRRRSSSTVGKNNSKTTTSNKNNNNRSNSNKKKSDPNKSHPTVQFLHVQTKEHDSDTLKGDFDSLANKVDSLSKFKFLTKLEQRLQTAVSTSSSLSSTTTDGDDNKQDGRFGNIVDYRGLLNMTIEFCNTRHFPSPLKDIILHRLIAGSESYTNISKSNGSNRKGTTKHNTAVTTTTTTTTTRTVDLWMKAREIAIDQPFIWSRERKRKLHKILKGSSSSTTTSSPRPCRATTLEVYRQTVRSPTLRVIHDTHVMTGSDDNDNDDEGGEDDLGAFKDINTVRHRYHRDQAEALVRHLQAKLPERKYWNLFTFIESYVTDYTGGIQPVYDASRKVDFADDSVDDEDSNKDDVDDDVNGTSTVGGPSSHQSFHILCSPLKAITQDHFHLVAQEIANFLYVTVTDEVTHPTHQRQRTGPRVIEDDGVAIPQQQVMVMDETIVTTDPRIQQKEEAWDAARDQYVRSFKTIQKLLLDAYVTRDTNQKHGRGDVTPDITTSSDGDDDELQEETIINDGRDSADPLESSVLKSFYEASSFHNPDMTLPSEAVKPIRPRTYVKYEAMVVGSLSSSQQDGEKARTFPDLSYSTNVFGDADVFPVAAPTDRLVIVDNLPIDITEHRLLEAYGRCGPIAGLKIYHQRPELDPGRKPSDSGKKIRIPSLARPQRRQRPRTPLYAVILYEDARSAATAVSDPLRIFGMVLDKHLIRSYRPRTVTKLYLEDVSSTTHDIASVEYELSQLLHPDLYVCLDTMNGVQRPRSTKSTGGLSCVIQFPNFEATYWAYWKLSLELELLREDKDCALHWMETPNDAMLYWTRKLNF